MNKHTVSVLDIIGGRFLLPPSLALSFQGILAFITLTVAMLLLSRLAIAEPYIPQSDTTVLEYLPAKLSILTSNISSTLFDKTENGVNWQSVNEKRWQQQEKLINAYLVQAKSSGDMRYISYAQNRLAHWLQQEPESEKARLLNAQIQQYNHNFDDAIVELKSLLNDYPQNTAAWSLLANLQLLTGHYQAAESSCRQLSASGSLTETIICQSNIMIRTGLLDKAQRLLQALLPIIFKMPVQQQLWLYTSLAEIKMQQGNNQLAGEYIEQAIKLAENKNIDDVYLSRMHVDYLIQNKRIKEAFERVTNTRNDSALMIRAAVLAKQLGDDAVLQNNRAALIQIFEVEKRRGQSRHLREQALFTLMILDDAVAALKLAKQNWVLQKEPEDARILMKAALSVDDPAQLQQVKLSVKKTGLLDQRLDIIRLRESLI